MKLARLFISATSATRQNMHTSHRTYSSKIVQLTFFDLMSLARRRFERRHWRLLDDIRQRRRLEVLLARLLLSVVLARVLLEALEAILLLTVHVDVSVEELARLLAHVQHVLRRRPGASRPCQHIHTPKASRTERCTHPNISTIRVIWLYSLVPGKSGRPKKSSTAMQPSDHMSIAAVYGIPRRTSGDR